MPEDLHQDILDALGIKPLALDTTGASGGQMPGVTYSIGVNPSTHQTTTEGLGDALKKSKNLRDILNLDPVIHGKTSEYGPLPAGNIFARGAGALTGVSDALTALRGEFTPEEAKGFALTAGMGLLPGARAEKAVMTMGKLFPEVTGIFNSKIAQMTPNEYVKSLGTAKQFAETFPASWEKMLPHLKGDNSFESGPDMVNAGIAATNKNVAQWMKKDTHPIDQALEDTFNAIKEALSVKDEGIPNKDISQGGIDKALAKNPGASIFDVAGLHEGGAKQDWEQKFKAGLDYSKQNRLREGDFPHEVPFGVPPKAQGLGFTTPVVHGTPDRYGWEGPLDQLKLPENQLGVHFGNPAQAAHFSIPGNVPDYLADKNTYRASTPRTYPAVLQVQNPLETADMGSWGHENMIEALHKINEGTLMSYAGGTRQVSPGLKGQFPLKELDQLKNIQDVRDYLADKGFDSIKYTNSVEDPGHTSYIMFQGSPTAPNYVTGVRSPFAQFDPSKLHLPSLTATGAGILAYPLTRQGDEEQ